ncbi:phage tail tube protein [Heliophilum fasciatum]|uniref:TP901-1 family phage major tail protein n=1 Tax=Heliophilum fasciatum TaxID=35700 RepID=A0A4R2RF68_9FIRM|nr:phage tail protein [Heliophilum fasciatum]MCW2279108.1 TP901-1 family phage major tail protein [Heliophilum fasciatum]TCP61264.1 TP901-1 family phage major tail protein [Heliophilum fasciatum]
MTKLAGVDVLLYVKTGGTDASPTYTVLGGQSGATLNRTTHVVDVTSKDANGWAENVAGVNSWTLECNGFLIADDAAITFLEQAWIGRQQVKAEIRFPSGRKYDGNCIISDFPYEFPQDGAATFKLSLTGTGALTTVTGS